MKKSTDLLKRLTLLSLACLAAGAQAQTDAYPSKPIRLVVSLPPGGGADGLARIWGEYVTKTFGAAVVVENRAGVNGSMAAGYVATQAPDGYTILLGTQSNLALNRFSYAKLSYDTEKSFADVGMLATTPQVLVVNSEVPANNVADFVKLAKAAPGKYSFSSAGKGNSTHLNMEIFAKHFQLDMLSVPYKGSAAAALATIAGETQVMSGVPSSAMPFIKEGKLKPLMVFFDKRLPELPGVPTAAESGIAKTLGGGWYALSAPKGTPEAIIQKLNAVTVKMWADKDARQKLNSIFMIQPADLSPGHVAAASRRDAEQWGPLVKSFGLKEQ